MKIEGIKALIFDLGGTLYRPVSNLCGLTRDFLIEAEVGTHEDFPDTTIRRAIQEPDEWLTSYMIENEVDQHWQPSNEHWIEYDKLLLKALGVEDTEVVMQYQSKWDEFVEDSTPEIMNGCKECLEELHERGFKLGIASNRFRDPSKLLMKDSIHGLFDAIEYTNVPGYRKPSPFMLLRLTEELQINPRKCAYIGNIVEQDIVAAERAGMLPILLTWLDPQEYDKITSDVIVIEDIMDLLEIL
ncbi:MAG: HAD family hydrolase [Candidatus Thorarchaeota archaeon]|nr:HAD family hydrolase [Candidatus Thorarchaeota archaeon]